MKKVSKLTSKLKLFKAIKEGLTEVEKVKKSHLNLQTLKDFLRENKK